MANFLDGLDRYLLISADCHAGPSPKGYGPYLEKKWQDDFKGWLDWSVENSKIMKQVMGPRSIGVDGDPALFGYRNWDSQRRLEETEADGVVAEVVYSNTSPPFAPTMHSEFGEAEVGEDLARRWAGIQAHNRWLADYCAEAPHRRAGVCQIFLPFVEESLEEIRWARETGLTGGVLLPGAAPGSGIEPLYSPLYEPIFALCEELGMPLNHHAGGNTPDFGPYLPQSLAMFMLEVTWWAHRSLWHLMFSGVFERHPKLQFVLTEVGTSWVGETLARLDGFYDRMKYNDLCAEHIFGGPTVASMSLRPSEYFERQVHLGASFLPAGECALRHEVGVEKIMWGSDYPHMEGSHPYTREHLRLSFAGVDPEEIQMMVGLNAAKVYGFDVEKLVPVAEKIGPTKAEIAAPLDRSDVPKDAYKCPAFEDKEKPMLL